MTQLCVQLMKSYKSANLTPQQGKVGEGLSTDKSYHFKLRRAEYTCQWVHGVQYTDNTSKIND